MSDTGGADRGGQGRRAVTLDDLAKAAQALHVVQRRDLEPGDRLVISTRNSVYSLTANGDGSFEASGGWFERSGRGETNVEVRGCTAGGHAIFTDHVAACGLFMELANGVRTTRIRSVRMIPVRDRS